MTITACRSCGSVDLVQVLCLGDQHLSDFRDDDTRPPKFPLRLLLCQTCTLAQLDTTTPRELMYHDRYGFRSGVNEAIRADLADIVAYAQTVVPAPRAWLDIAANDGTLLSMVPSQVWRVGVDPVAAFAPEARRHANWVFADYFRPELFTGTRKFDIVTSISMFYDLDDPGAFVAGVKEVLADDGAWIIQQNYLLSMLELNAVDNICHEHVTYYSLVALEHLLHRYGLQVNDVTLSDVNGGCIRTLVTRTGTRPVSASVQVQRDREAAAGLGDLDTYRRWGAHVRGLLADLRDLIVNLNAQGRRVYVYGASTRGGTILQAAGLGPDMLPVAVERQAAKVGKVWSATGIPIISEEQARAEHPDCMLVSPWFFRSLFVEREAAYLAAGGRLIFPLPALEVVQS